MPHATEDEMMEETEAGLRWAMQQEGGMGGINMGDNYVIDQADKADDAVDFEDISDDDLPEEEEATHAAGDDDAIDSAFDVVPGGMGGLPELSHMNGFSDVKESSEDGYEYGNGEDAKDLFGEHISSSPELERHPQPTNGHFQAPHRPGLALPTKSALALPTSSASSFPLIRIPPQPASQSSLSPPPLHDGHFSALSPASMTEEEDVDMDPDEAMQRRLFNLAKRKLDGEAIDNDRVDLDQDSFHKLYPSYDKHQAPRFIDLFPPRNVQYKGKAPLKPPKPVHPTKLSLDLLQDQERTFRSLASGNKAGQDSTFNNSIIHLGQATADKDDSDDDLASSSDFDVNERIGNVTMADLALICQDWDLPSIDSASVVDELVLDGHASDSDWDAEDSLRPSKKRRTDGLNAGVAAPWEEHYLSFEEPERATARLAKSVALDLNDPNLLVDEHAPRIKKRIKRMPGDRRDAALSRDIAKRYNISNDLAYDLLKENHQHKVRSTLGSMAVEHSNPATKLQFPFYKVSLDSKVKRAFHRPQLELRQTPYSKELKFSKPKHIKRKNVKGREAKEVFAKAEDLSLGDNASMLLLEYSEEAPMMLSNFGMGSRLINYYRKRDADDQERPKEPIGETQVLLTQDKSPFANFGHVDKGETVPTVQNGLFRAPVFPHRGKTTDFIIGVSSTYETYDRLYLRNVENLHVVGQQFPLAEVPGQHSRKVTDAAKKRLKALAYRIYNKSLTRKDKVLDNATLMPHLPGHDMPQTRSKMREFMKYERTSNRGEGSNGVWVPMPGHSVPDADTLRGWIRPEDVCLLDSMQVGVQYLSDLGISETKEVDEDKEVDEGETKLEQQLAPWRATKNFLNATQGKAMLAIHGEGDPTDKGLAFSFVKTSMKGGFKAAGESINDKLDAHKRSQNGGHSYNVAKQQKAYDDSIRRIWDAQKSNLSEQRENEDDGMDEDLENETGSRSHRAETPRSYAGTPGGTAHQDDDMSQISGRSQDRGDKTLIIRRVHGKDSAGNPREDEEVVITNPKVIKRYQAAQMEKSFANAKYGGAKREYQELTDIHESIHNFVPTGDAERDRYAKEKLEKELIRIKRNADRREARERLKKGKTGDGATSAAASPGPSDADGPASAINGATDGTTQKGKGRTKDGTARKCANCGQVGHIKTNRKLCPLLNGTMKPEDAGMNGDNSFGAVAAPLTL